MSSITSPALIICMTMTMTMTMTTLLLNINTGYKLEYTYNMIYYL